jgi:hypothetical protein
MFQQGAYIFVFQFLYKVLFSIAYRGFISGLIWRKQSNMYLKFCVINCCGQQLKRLLWHFLSTRHQTVARTLVPCIVPVAVYVQKQQFCVFSWCSSVSFLLMYWRINEVTILVVMHWYSCFFFEVFQLFLIAQFCPLVQFCFNWFYFKMMW